MPPRNLKGDMNSAEIFLCLKGGRWHGGGLICRATLQSTGLNNSAAHCFAENQIQRATMLLCHREPCVNASIWIPYVSSWVSSTGELHGQLSLTSAVGQKEGLNFGLGQSDQVNGAQSMVKRIKDTVSLLLQYSNTLPYWVWALCDVYQAKRVMWILDN